MGLTLNLDEGDSVVLTLESGETARVIFVRKSTGRRAKLVIEAPPKVDVRRELATALKYQRLKKA